MIEISGEQRRAFAYWLRTGRLPQVRDGTGIELKFNPWHDPDNGRFTFVGSGNHFADETGGAEAWGGRGAERKPPKIAFRDDPAKPPITSKAEADGWRARNLSKYGNRPDNRRAIEAKYREYINSLKISDALPQSAAMGSRTGEPSNQLVEFATGASEGAYGTAVDTAKSLYLLATTNPVATVRGIESNLANMVDRAVAAEDTPAHVQVSRAAKAIADASTRDVGRVAGSTAANLALTLAPGAALSKISRVRRTRLAKLRETYPEFKLDWKRETHRSEEPWVAYNNSAPGARLGQAPALSRLMPDGSTRLVKFDGIRGDYVIDRKWKIRDQSHARAQALRQSDVLRQHRVIGVWEVPNAVQMRKAIKMLERLKITNIHVQVVAP